MDDESGDDDRDELTRCVYLCTVYTMVQDSSAILN